MVTCVAALPAVTAALAQVDHERGGAGAEVAVPAYEAMHRDGSPGEQLCTILMGGVSTRHSERVVPDLAERCEVSKSAVRREFAAASAEQLRALCERRLDALELPVIYLDAVRFGLRRAETISCPGSSLNSVGPYAQRALTELGPRDVLQPKMILTDHAIERDQVVANGRAQAGFMWLRGPLQTGEGKTAEVKPAADAARFDFATESGGSSGANLLMRTPDADGNIRGVGSSSAHDPPVTEDACTPSSAAHPATRSWSSCCATGNHRWAVIRSGRRRQSSPPSAACSSSAWCSFSRAMKSGASAMPASRQ